MPNSIIYNVSTQSLALKKGNFYIGTGDVSKGPTSSTGYFDGVTPSSNQYVIYYNKNGSNRIYYCTNGDQVYLITNRLKGQNLTTLETALNYIATQSDMMCTNIQYGPIVTNGLVLSLDAGFVPSYPTSGTTWYDMSGTNNGTLVNGPTYDSANGGSIVFDATDDICTFPVGTFNSGQPQNGTYYFRIKYPPYPSVQNQLFNESGTGFNSGIVYYRNPFTTANLYFFVNYYNTPTGTGSVTTGGPGDLPAGTWVDVAFTFNSSGGWSTYRNGVLANSGTATNFVSWKRDGTGVPRIKPSSPDGAGSQQLFYYYNRALSASEILQIFNATKNRVGL
jgi:hypothetical protein